MGVRHGLARVLSKRGLCSRSEAERLIREGRVRLDGRVVRDPEHPADVSMARIEIDGAGTTAAIPRYLMLNKPRGLVTTARDERGRDTVYRCFDGAGLGHVAPVGRLDKASEGLLLATNDPAWAARIGPVGNDPGALDAAPIVGYEEELPLLSGFWLEVFGTRPANGARVVVPDLRAVLECVRNGAGIAVVPRYLCAEAFAAGELVPLVEPQLPPLRTYFLVVRAGTLALPHLARAHERLLRAACDW